MIDYNSDQKPALYGAVELGRRTVPNVLAGKRVILSGVPLNEPSDYALALAGAAVLHAQGDAVPADLWLHALENENWSGGHANPRVRYVHYRRLTDDERQSVDDRNGVVTAVPTLAWKAVMCRTLQKTAVAHACNIRLLLPANRVPGGILSTPDGAPLDLKAMMRSVDQMTEAQTQSQLQLEPTRTLGHCTIHVAAAAFDERPDFADPSDPLEVGRWFCESMSDKLAEWLDRVVIRGNGESEPHGALSEPERGPSNRFPAECYSDHVLLGRMVQAIPDMFVTEAGARLMCLRGPQPVFPVREVSDALAPFVLHPALGEGQVGMFLANRYRGYLAPGFSLRTETVGRLHGGGPDLLVARLRFGGRIEHQWCAASNL